MIPIRPPERPDNRQTWLLGALALLAGIGLSAFLFRGGEDGPVLASQRPAVTPSGEGPLAVPASSRPGRPAAGSSLTAPSDSVGEAPWSRSEGTFPASVRDAEERPRPWDPTGMIKGNIAAQFGEVAETAAAEERRALEEASRAQAAPQPRRELERVGREERSGFLGGGGRAQPAAQARPIGVEFVASFRAPEARALARERSRGLALPQACKAARLAPQCKRASDSCLRSEDCGRWLAGQLGMAGGSAADVPGGTAGGAAAPAGGMGAIIAAPEAAGGAGRQSRAAAGGLSSGGGGGAHGVGRLSGLAAAGQGQTLGNLFSSVYNSLGAPDRAALDAACEQRYRAGLSCTITDACSAAGIYASCRQACQQAAGSGCGMPATPPPTTTTGGPGTTTGATATTDAGTTTSTTPGTTLVTAANPGTTQTSPTTTSPTESTTGPTTTTTLPDMAPMYCALGIEYFCTHSVWDPPPTTTAPETTTTGATTTTTAAETQTVGRRLPPEDRCPRWVRGRLVLCP